MSKIARLALIPLALLCVAFIRLVWPLWKIRLGVLMADRIGHLSGNTEIYLCEREAGQHKGFTDLWTTYGSVSNKQLLIMLSRCMTIDRTKFLTIVIICNKLFQGWQKHDIAQGNLDRDSNNLLEKYPPHLTFTAREEAHGEAELQAIGIPAGAKWVCLIVRDAAYLPELSYHSYRDTDVDTYALAAYGLATRGYYVLRMGAKVCKSFGATHPRIIDYASSGFRSEFMDIYLGAKCDFCVSTGCGFDGIPYIFRRPICYVNYVPLEYLFSFVPRSLAIFKHHEKDGKRMKLSEIFESGAGQFMRAEQFQETGITLVDNHPGEIAEVVSEMADSMSPTYHKRDHVDPDGATRQDRFWDAFPRSISEYTNRSLHGEIRMRIGREFVKGYTGYSL